MSKISVVIPTYNRAEKLKINLEGLTKQLRFGDEVIIIDDGSDVDEQKKLEVITKKPQIEVFKNIHGGPASCRNIGIEKSKGDIILFLNDDSIASDGLIQKHREFHEEFGDLNQVMVGRYRMLPELINNPAARWLADKSGYDFVDLFGDKNRVDWRFFWTCNLSIKKEFLTNNNLRFDSEFETAAWEDIEMGYRCRMTGMELYGDKEAMVWHNHEIDFEEILKRFMAHGRGLALLKKKVPQNYLPPLGKDRIFVTAKVIMKLLPISYIENRERMRYAKKSELSNLFMQVLVISQKIKGYEEEINK